MEKSRLTLVYVDGAARVLKDNQETRPLNPTELEPLVLSASTDSEVVRYVFLDDRRGEETSASQAYNYQLNTWSNFDYTTVACTRINDLSKESIDFVLINHLQRQIKLLKKSYTLQVVLVFGDADYRSLISSLLGQGISVSLIIANPNAAMHSTLTDRCEVCWILFPLRQGKEEERQFKSLEDTCRQFTERHGTFLQASYGKQSPSSLYFLDGFLACTYDCIHCGERVPFFERTTHPCARSKHPPAGLMTKTHRRKLAAILTKYSSKELLYWYLEQHQREVDMDELAKVFHSMETIPWEVLDMIRLLDRLKISPQAITNQQEDKLVNTLVAMGIVEQKCGSYFPTEKRLLLDPLQEEIRSRIHYPHTAKRFSPAGAPTEERLRQYVAEQLAALIPPEPHTHHDQTNEGIQDEILKSLVDPALRPEQRRELIKQFGEKHLFTIWAHSLMAFTNDKTNGGDILEVSERILREIPIKHAVDILVVNTFLLLDEKRQQLHVNHDHPFCLQLIIDREVA